MAVFNPNKYHAITEMLLDGLGFHYQPEADVFIRPQSDPPVSIPVASLDRHTPTSFYELMKRKGWWKETQDIPTPPPPPAPRTALARVLPPPSRILASRTSSIWPPGFYLKGASMRPESLEIRPRCINIQKNSDSFTEANSASLLESAELRNEADFLLAKLADRIRLAGSETSLRRFQAALSIVRYAYEAEIQTADAKPKMPPCGAPPDIVNHFLNQIEKSPAAFRPSLEEIRKIYPDAQPVPIPMWKYRELQKNRGKS